MAQMSLEGSRGDDVLQLPYVDYTRSGVRVSTCILRARIRQCTFSTAVCVPVRAKIPTNYKCILTTPGFS